MASVGFRLALVVPVALAFACEGGGRGRRPEASAGFTVVRAYRAESLAARIALERSESEVREGTPESETLRQARSAYDAAYTREQRALAGFLTVALNERPYDPETREALGWYAEAAVTSARIILERGGEARRALETLEGAERPFRALGLAVPHDLAASLEEARRAAASPPTATPTSPPAPAHRRQRRAGPSHR